ncbi:GGDEF domain-containing protein [Sphingomicrobium clamense]|uniref:diguanylate cyclase n=1 Tax=Sphingomicrobium clamense TaxID=2851013 RepID=A0ABS6V7N6_9SPHN|nr:GGDEF domain-containing protein [Sphingomicrobium sp. B8]
MIDSAIFLLVVPGFFLVLALILALLAIEDRGRKSAIWGAAAFLVAGIGAIVDLFRPPGDEWLKWLTLTIHFATLLLLSKAFLVRKRSPLPGPAIATLAIPILYFPLFGVDHSENTRTIAVQIAAFILTASVVWQLVRTRGDALIDKIAIAVLGFGSVTYLVRIFVFGAFVTEDSAGRFFDDTYNIVFHLTSAAFGLLAGLALLVAIGVDTVLEHARKSAIDPLTGLGNRRALDDAIDMEGRRKWRCGGVIAIDMDHFKSVNDRFGHPEGDRLLVAVAKALEKRIGECGHLCRLGGEEFMALIEQEHKERLEELAVAAHEAIGDVSLDGPLAGYQPSASVGFHVRNAGATLTEAMRLADQALYRAKGLGRDCVVGARHANGVTVMTEALEKSA